MLQSVDGSEVVIPNQQMLSSTIISFSTNPFRRIELDVGVDYNTDLPMVTSLIRGIIEKDKDIVITEPNVAKVNMMGQETFQISGKVHEREKETIPEINEDDIQTVALQANVTLEEAKAAIEESKGDLAEAILKLKSN